MVSYLYDPFTPTICGLTLIHFVLAEFCTHVELMELGEAIYAYPGVVKFSPDGTDTINQLLSYTPPDPLTPPDEMMV